MSQRNPMNERYTTDDHQGKTRKSAASMKPKTKAAASVRVQSTQKTRQQKKAEQKAQQKAQQKEQRTKQRNLDRKYYSPPTAEYKRLHRMWIACLVGAVTCTLLSWFARSAQPEWLSFVPLGLAYVLIIVSFYIDFSKIRKVRQKYQEEMMAKKSKEMRAAEKKQRATQRQTAAESKEESSAAEAPKKRGLFGGLFSFGKSKRADTVEQASENNTSEAK